MLDRLGYVDEMFDRSLQQQGPNVIDGSCFKTPSPDESQQHHHLSDFNAGIEESLLQQQRHHQHSLGGDQDFIPNSMLFDFDNDVSTELAAHTGRDGLIPGDDTYEHCSDMNAVYDGDMFTDRGGLTTSEPIEGRYFELSVDGGRVSVDRTGCGGFYIRGNDVSSLGDCDGRFYGGVEGEKAIEDRVVEGEYKAVVTPQNTLSDQMNMTNGSNGSSSFFGADTSFEQFEETDESNNARRCDASGVDPATTFTALSTSSDHRFRKKPRQANEFFVMMFRNYPIFAKGVSICVGCKTQMATNAEVEAHVVAAGCLGPNGVQPATVKRSTVFKCTHCEMTFWKAKSCRQHQIESCLPSNGIDLDSLIQPSVACPLCATKSYNRSGLMSHMKYKHAMDTKGVRECMIQYGIEKKTSTYTNASVRGGVTDVGGKPKVCDGADYRSLKSFPDGSDFSYPNCSSADSTHFRTKGSAASSNGCDRTSMSLNCKNEVSSIMLTCDQ